MFSCYQKNVLAITPQNSNVKKKCQEKNNRTYNSDRWENFSLYVLHTVDKLSKCLEHILGGKSNILLDETYTFMK